MTPHDWTRVRELFDSALALEVGTRAAFLDRECAEDQGLRAEVASLLAAHDGAGDFIESPVYEVAPELLAEPAAFSLAGKSIGPYLVRHEIGRGGMGVVYLADDTRLSRRIALKAIAPGFQSDPGRRERLRQEARAAAALSHPGIATVYAIEEIDNELYLACEYVAGPTLRAIIDSGPMPADLVIDLAAQLAHALAAAHAQGVVHRDLKPENIVRTSSGTVKVLDFGVARIENVSAGLGSRLTAAGIAIGTPGYMSPEQIRHEEVDFRTDVFSFGVVLYEMATRTNPFEAKTATASIARILEAEPAPLHFIGLGASAGVEQIVTRCLRKRREDRYDSTLALVQDLERLQRGLLLPARQPIAGDGVGFRRAATRHTSALWWWECHQLVASVVYALMVYPAFRARLWIPRPWSLIVFLSLLAAAATAISVRLHLFFTSRSYPSQLSSQRARARLWTHCSDTVFAAGLLLDALVIAGDHSAVAALLLAVSVAATVSMLIIEPATAGAAFVPSGTSFAGQDRRSSR